jgi:PAS domain S-box-containing protein
MQGNLIDVNKQYEEITGYSLEELKKLSYWDITPKKYEEDEARQIESLKETGKYGPYRKEYIKKSGEIIPVELNGFVVNDFDGQEGIWSIVEDISEQLKQENDILQQKQIALQQSKLASIGELAAGVGHEINNPLAIAKGNLITLDRKIDKGDMDPESIKNDIRKIQSATDRIVRIVKGLRTFSRSDVSEVKDFS